ncbi:UvrD-helicase domain-containing protein [Nocardioides pelophilus]|uniref:UvrD-helicase domain-containing protein n=1 Tax=Nocardioides pelophilus TaxID=2172019 RepID=UPI001600ABD6|nr:UvrD-helicase domain-containing protein [Nocardioides pelophilus]
MTDVALDPSQLEAVQIEPEERQIVIAGPGSGKTEVVSALIEHLTEEAGVDAVDGLLVISFSNAAVNAAEGRLRAHGAAPVSVQTMDSLAAEILRELATEDYKDLDFDDRVEEATRLLADDGWDRIGDLQHLIVDEVQDVVGVRADFLRSILSAMPADAGFSLLGDPAQGIYDFQLRETRRGRGASSTTTSTQLLESVSEAHAPTLRELTGQYRASSRDSQAAMRLRDAALPHGDASALEGFFADLIHLGQIEDAVDLLGSWRGSTALLTATNGQALATAGALRRLGVGVEIRRSAHQQVAASWVAATLGDSTTDSVSKADFEKLISDRRPDVDAAAAWRALRSLVGARGTEITVSSIANRVRAGRRLLPDLAQSPVADVVVSTVHRAKGLEFDNVVLLDFPVRGRAAADTEIDEVRRTQFVALTRARSYLVRADGPDDRDLRLATSPTARRTRWYVGGHKPWMTFGFEIGIGDTEPIFDNPAPSQAHIVSEVAPGSELALRLDVEPSTLDLPVYAVVHNGTTIARTSRMFGEDLASRIGTLERRRGTWPDLRGAQVEAIATAASDPRPDSPWRHGLYLAPIITGLLTLDWNGAAE